MSKESLGHHLWVWEKLAATVEHNAGDLPAAQEYVAILRAAVAEALEAKQRQLALHAAAQQASRDLEAALEKGRDMEARLNRGVFAAYGRKSPKLVEFGLSPRKPTGPRKKKSPESGNPGESPDSSPPAENKPPKRRKH